MVGKKFVVFLALICGLAAAHKIVKKVPPKFSDGYKVSGTLRLPYAELNENFDVWFDGPNKCSRIDYYNGNFINIQHGDVSEYGTDFVVLYLTNYAVTNKRSCFEAPGTVDMPIMPQTILPDTTNMSYYGVERIGDYMCDVWRKVVVNGKKTSTYSLYVDQYRGNPIRYEMMGFDSLLGSHYDKYVLDYHDYIGGISISSDIFNVSAIANLSCSGFPGPGDAKEHRLVFNPMHEFVHGDDSHVPEMFHRFKTQHSKVYKDNMEHEIRQNHFRQNVRYVHSKNRAGLSYKLAINHLADRSDEELKLMNGFRRSMNYDGIQGKPFNMKEFENASIPDQMDWRLYGAVTPVKDQGVCGSCWSFGTTGTLEGALFMKTGNLIRLSQQELVDCSWGEGNNGCDGGEDFRAYNWIMHPGIDGLTSEAHYGPYEAVDGKCGFPKKLPAVVQLAGYVNVTAYDQTALKTAIAMKGPVSVAIDASHKSLSFYANGVYYEPACGSKPEDLDHAVLAVGYGEMNGEPYWLIKNSWSTYWGNAGYVLMSQKNNNCGVATSPTYPILK